MTEGARLRRGWLGCYRGANRTQVPQLHSGGEGAKGERGKRLTLLLSYRAHLRIFSYQLYLSIRSSLSDHVVAADTT